MKILYHHRTKSRDGQFIHIQALISAFRRAGHEVDEQGLTATKSSSLSEKSHFWDRFVELVPRKIIEVLEYIYSVPAAIWLWSRIVKDRPDFIYERYALGNYAGVLAAHWARLPIVLEVNSPLAREKNDTGQLHFKWLAETSERNILKWATKIIVVSGVLKEIFVQQGIDPRKLIVIPNGIHAHDYLHRNGSTSREKYGLGDSIVIGFIGFFREWHKLDQVLDLFADQLYDLNVKLLMVGDGPVRGELEDKVRALNLHDRVIWTGIVEHARIPDALSAMDIALQPGVTEYASPLKIFDYMAAGRAIVAPRQKNILELLDDNETGLLYEPGNMKEMGEALRRLVLDPELRERIGRAARNRLEEGGFTWDSNAERVLQLFDRG
ncbi:MAG: glycosyltransferase family 4 protein [Planctomycetota bacterium]